MKIKIIHCPQNPDQPWCVFLRDEESVLNSAWSYHKTKADAQEFSQGLAEIMTHGIQMNRRPA